VLAENEIDLGPVWRAYSFEDADRKAHTGAPMNEMVHDRGLSTDIGWQDRDYSGSPLSRRTRSQYYRMRKWHKRARVTTSRDRNLTVALQELNRMGSQLELAKSIRENAARYYRHSIAENLIRGRSIEGVTAACVYLSCREAGVPRTLREVAEAARTGRKEIGRIARFLMRRLKIRVEVPRPEMYTQRFCSDLELCPAVIGRANEIIQQCEEFEHDSGKGPTGICASAIYIASLEMEAQGVGRRCTQRDIAEAAGVTEVTVRNRYKDICALLNINVSPTRSS